jgi:hypothetical protein
MNKKLLLLLCLGILFLFCLVSAGALFLVIKKNTENNNENKTETTTVVTDTHEENEVIIKDTGHKRLIFIHHSTGENWLNDDNGGLGKALAGQGYYVSDTNYGWGPTIETLGGPIGDYTDIGYWWNWFRGPDSTTILNSLYTATDQNSLYTRLESIEDVGNDIIIFKSCFPNSALKGSINDSVPLITNNPLKGQDSSSEFHTIANAKGIYIDLLNYFKTQPGHLFVVVTAPPLSDPTYASNVKAFNEWLLNDWLKDYDASNVVVFDFFSILANNNGTLKYPVSPEDDHPSKNGNLLATEAFIPFLNDAYAKFMSP